MQTLRAPKEERNATYLTASASVSVLAGGTGSATVYTVPADRRAIVHSVFLRTFWTAAPAAGDRARAEIELRQTGATIGEVVGVQPASTDADDRGYAHAAPQVILRAGATIVLIVSAIGSAVGLDVEAVTHVTEYDQ